MTVKVHPRGKEANSHLNGKEAKNRLFSKAVNSHFRAPEKVAIDR